MLLVVTIFTRFCPLLENSLNALTVISRFYSCYNCTSVFFHFISVGKVVKHLSLSLFGSSFLGSVEHAGFLYVHATLQSLQGLPLPNQPYLFGLLVHRAEVAWAKAFPLRLMLRLGAEYRCKPGVSMKSCMSMLQVFFQVTHFLSLSSLPVSPVQCAL